jgi:hypothetical protein
VYEIHLSQFFLSQADQPPSIICVVPVVKPDSSDPR